VLLLLVSRSIGALQVSRMKYATFGTDGKLNGRYDSTINSVIPEGAFELTDDAFYQTISLTKGYWELVNGVLTYTIPPVDPLAQNQVPAKVTMRQARLALLQGGYLPTVNTLVASIPGPTGDEARVTWDYSSDVERTNPLVAQIAAALPLTSAQVDDLFILAASL
jgi:hypothetical protein